MRSYRDRRACRLCLFENFLVRMRAYAPCIVRDCDGERVRGTCDQSLYAQLALDERNRGSETKFFRNFNNVRRLGRFGARAWFAVFNRFLSSHLGVAFDRELCLCDRNLLYGDLVEKTGQK